MKVIVRLQVYRSLDFHLCYVRNIWKFNSLGSHVGFFSIYYMYGTTFAVLTVSLIISLTRVFSLRSVGDLYSDRESHTMNRTLCDRLLRCSLVTDTWQPWEAFVMTNIWPVSSHIDHCHHMNSSDRYTFVD